jgi:hypothetical protein
MPTELMCGQKPIMPAEEIWPSWSFLSWKDEMDHESLLAMRIRQLQRLLEDLEHAKEKLKEARLKSKERFDKVHHLRPQPIQRGDLVLVHDSSLENQHSSEIKFARRWFGPYVVEEVHASATYLLGELDGASVQTPIAGKRIKLFRK